MIVIIKDKDCANPELAGCLSSANLIPFEQFKWMADIEDKNATFHKLH